MRSGYSDDADGPELAMWRGRVASAMRGNRGQQLLRDLLTALDEMPKKRLIANELVNADGEVCLLGAGGRKRAIEDIDKIDPEDHDVLAKRFNVAGCMIQEIEFINDYGGYYAETAEKRFSRVRRWVAENIKPVAEGSEK